MIKGQNDKAEQTVSAGGQVQDLIGGTGQCLAEA